MKKKEFLCDLAQAVMVVVCGVVVLYLCAILEAL